MYIMFFVFGVIAAILITQNKLEDHLDDQAQAHANDSFPDRYFDTWFGAPFRQSLELKGNRLIHRSRNGKTTINLYQVNEVNISFFRVIVVLRNGETIKLPLGFEHLTEIYTILKYYRPDESRSALSTRHT